MTGNGSPSRRGQCRFLIVTADDFGLHEAVNEAVEQASRTGVLTAASLMVAAPAAADAIHCQEVAKLGGAIAQPHASAGGTERTVTGIDVSKYSAHAQAGARGYLRN